MVSSAVFFGSAGAAIVIVFFSTVSRRCCSGVALSALNVAARLAKSVTAVAYASLARADIASVSGVMKVAWVNPAWFASLLRRKRVASAFSRKLFRSEPAGGAAARHAPKADRNSVTAARWSEGRIGAILGHPARCLTTARQAAYFAGDYRGSVVHCHCYAVPE